MYFYEVLVASQRFHGHTPLTYASEDRLALGSVLVVPMRGYPALGIVVRAVSKPTFATKLISRLAVDTPLPEPSLQLLSWLQMYYPAPLGLITGLFVPAGLLQQARADKALSQAPASTSTWLPLTRQQVQAVKTIMRKPPASVWLHGDTGTGKTRVYQEIAQRVLNEGRSVLILTPEIGLTPQLVRTFEAAFGSRVIVTHSNLSPAQRRQIWLQILRAEQPMVVVGPRSALFSPFQSLGLIVVDEAHDSAYKQEQAPRYQSLRVAAKLAELHQARLVLGTATPPISEYHLAQVRGLPIVRLTDRPALSAETHLQTTGLAASPQITVVNLRDRQQFNRNPHLSDTVLEAIQAVLARGEQALVFLNRRGTARVVLCEACGWQAVCPRCGLPLTYHGDSHEVRCHTCGYRTTAPLQCPQCGSPQIAFKTLGTKALVEILQRHFPRAQIRRFDTDNSKAERLEQQYQEVLSGKVDILVGTQLLVKGLDLPRLSLVGVVLADTSLYFPDYTSDERTYQLLTQVIGRIGRGHRPGMAIIQTYNPDGPALQAVLSKDYDAFYTQQLVQRQLFGFPPYWHVLKLTVERRSVAAAEQATTDLAEQLKSLGGRVVISDSAPAFYERRGGHYRWQLIVKAKNRTELLKLISHLPTKVIYDLDPVNLL